MSDNYKTEDLHCTIRYLQCITRRDEENNINALKGNKNILIFSNYLLYLVKKIIFYFYE